MEVKGIRKTSEKHLPIKTPDVELAVVQHYDYRKYLIVPNISWGFLNHEADLLIVSKSNYCTEVEIKVSKSDFLNDFKKPHQHISRYVKYFYYAMPHSLYEKVKDQIPTHAGVITCDYDYRGRVRARIEKMAVADKKAQVLTTDEVQKVLRLAHMRVWSLKEKLNKIRREKDELKLQNK